MKFAISLSLLLAVGTAFADDVDNNVPNFPGFEPGIPAIYYRKIRPQHRDSLTGRSLFNIRELAQPVDQQKRLRNDATNGIPTENAEQTVDTIDTDDDELTSNNGRIIPVWLKPKSTFRQTDRNQAPVSQAVNSKHSAAVGTENSELAAVELVQKLGDACLNDTQCVKIDSKAICYNGKCICEPIYHVAGSARDCFNDNVNKTADGLSKLVCVRKQKLGNTCCDSRQCRFQVPNSECSPTFSPTCVCKSRFVALGDHACLAEQPNFVGPCSTSAQCTVPHSQCGQEGYCEPANGYVYADYVTSSETNLLNLREKTQAFKITTIQFYAAAWLGEPCSQDNQCLAFVPNASECRAASSSVERDVNDTKVCTCKKGYVPLGTSTCVETIDTLYDASRPCSISRQCTQKYSTCATPNDATTAEAIRTPQCICDYAYQFAFPSAGDNNSTTFCCSFADYLQMPKECRLTDVEGSTHKVALDVAFSLFSAAYPGKAAAIRPVGARGSNVLQDGTNSSNVTAKPPVVG